MKLGNVVRQDKKKKPTRDILYIYTYINSLPSVVLVICFGVVVSLDPNYLTIFLNKRFFIQIFVLS